MKPAARLRSAPRCINRRADRKRRGSRSRHGASCPRCLAAVLHPGRTVSGLRPAKFPVLYNSAEDSAELQGGSTPTKQKFCAIRPPALSSSWFAALLAASPMPAAFPLEAPAAVAVPRWASVGRLPPLARLRPLQLRLRGSGPRPRLRPRRLCLFLFCLRPAAFPGWPQGRKNPNRGGRCQTRSRERFPDVAAAPAQAKGKSSSGGAAASPWLFCGASPQKWERSTMNSVMVRLLPSDAK